MLATNSVATIFSDARGFHADALRLLEAGDVRNAAEIAWRATKRATDALMLARTGIEPETASARSRRIVQSWLRKTMLFSLCMNAYHIRLAHLHGDCFNLGICIPLDEVEQRIRQYRRLHHRRRAPGRLFQPPLIDRTLSPPKRNDDYEIADL